MLKTTKIARSVTGEKIHFEGKIIVNVTQNKKTKKMKIFVLKNTDNLFGSDAIQEFDLWDSPISTLCKKNSKFNGRIREVTKRLEEVIPRCFFRWSGSM